MQYHPHGFNPAIRMSNLPRQATAARATRCRRRWTC